MKIVLFLFCFFLSLHKVNAQSREELEKQRQQLKNEIAETEKLLKANKTQTTENLYQWRLINNKVQLQDRVIDNISKDLRMLNNDIYIIQKDVNRYDRLLDTLKQEYAKSMVYAYKNRSNYDFLNFIFSADNFNDAIKRVAYLKSYRTYRETQGQNILRTQQLRRKRTEEINSAKADKGVTLKVQSKEMQTLEEQKNEKDKIVSDLKKKGKSLNDQIAAKQKQVSKVNNIIAATIRKAQAEARKAAMAKSAEEARLKKDADKKSDQATAANSRATNNTGNGNVNVPEIKSVASVSKKVATPNTNASVLLNDGNIALNASFEKNRGTLPWPVDNGYVLMHYGKNKLISGNDFEQTAVTIASPIGSTVKAVFEGVVVAVQEVDDMQVMVIQHGRYLTTYSNLKNAAVAVGGSVKTGQAIGKVAPNIEGVGTIDFYLSNEVNNVNPETWLRRR